MKWILKSPVYGNAVRVKAGSLYHYGIFVSENEIIQFGLHPYSRQPLKDGDVEVLCSDVETFLQGGFIEVGVPEKHERKKMLSPEQTVKRAKERLGEKGYNILYNNCEHFVYECTLDTHYCSQTQDLRDMIRNTAVADVYYAVLPDSLPKKLCIYPKSRKEDILSCKNEKVQREKYFVWKLLEYAVNHTLKQPLKKLKPYKAENGKWKSEKAEFSLAHSDGVVCVAICKTPVGVDVESVKSPTTTKILDKIFNEEDFNKYNSLDLDQKAEFFTTVWAQKESIFKMLDKDGFLTSNPKEYSQKATTRKITIQDKNYIISVACENDKLSRFHFVQEIN